MSLTGSVADGGPVGRTSLDVAVPAPFPRERVIEVLGPGRAAWIREEAGTETAAPPGMERHLVDLRMRVGERSSLVTFHKAAYLDVGSVDAADAAVSVEISWRAAGMAPLFPVFSGHLTWADDRLRVSGVYAPPGGGVGVIADRLLLNTAARGTARWLLDRITRVMAGHDADEAG